MGKVTPITEQFQHFVADLKESFWGDLYGKTRIAWKQFWEGASMRERSRYLARESYERREPGKRGDYRNGYDERDFVTRQVGRLVEIITGAAADGAEAGAEAGGLRHARRWASAVARFPAQPR